MYNTIRLIEFRAESLKPITKTAFDYALENDTDPKEVKRMEYTAENESEAKKWLSGKQNRIYKQSGFAKPFYVAEAYAVEFSELDEGGELPPEGRVDYDIAADRIEESEG